MGGVGRNLAAALHLLGHETNFLTAIQNDALGQFANENFLRQLNFSPNQLKLAKLNKSSSNNKQTPFSLVLIDSISGACQFVVANLDLVKCISTQDIQNILGKNCQTTMPSIVVCDANLSFETLSNLIDLCSSKKVPLFVEPTDVLALRNFANCLMSEVDLRSLFCISPNLLELQTLVSYFDNNNKLNQTQTTEQTPIEEAVNLTKVLMTKHMKHLTCLLVTLDKNGVVICVRKQNNNNFASNSLQNITINLSDTFNKSNNNLLFEENELIIEHFNPIEVCEKPVSGSGAGDCFAAAFISGLLAHAPLLHCLKHAFKASKMALDSRDTIPLELRNLRFQ